MPTLHNRKRRPAARPTPKLARERAYLALQQKMLSGEFPAGSPISEASLARELGISRTPLREAIGQLIAQGFLRPIPNRGTVVLEFGKRDIAEIYDVREALELYAVEKAAEAPIRAAEVEELIRLADEMLALRVELEKTGQSRLNAAQMQRFVASDFSYHNLLLRLADNARLVKAVGDGRVLLNAFAIRRRGHDPAQLEQIHRYHCGIVDAVIRQDAAEARRLLGEHIRLSKQERLREYEDLDRERVMRHAASSWNVPAEFAARE
jgi:DNA-binding GntR family transcriptional regulator